MCRPQATEIHFVCKCPYRDTSHCTHHLYIRDLRANPRAQSITPPPAPAATAAAATAASGFHFRRARDFQRHRDWEPLPANEDAQLQWVHCSRYDPLAGLGPLECSETVRDADGKPKIDLTFLEYKRGLCEQCRDGHGMPPGSKPIIPKRSTAEKPEEDCDSDSSFDSMDYWSDSYDSTSTDRSSEGEQPKKKRSTFWRDLMRNKPKSKAKKPDDDFDSDSSFDSMYWSDSDSSGGSSEGELPSAYHRSSESPPGKPKKKSAFWRNLRLDKPNPGLEEVVRGWSRRRRDKTAARRDSDTESSKSSEYWSARSDDSNSVPRDDPSVIPRSVDSNIVPRNDPSVVPRDDPSAVPRSDA